MTDLRPYQSEVIEHLRDAMRKGARRPLLVAPTGSGKTVIGSAVISSMLETGHRGLFLCHRRELIKQSSGKLYRDGVDHGVIAAGFPVHPGLPVQVASIATLHARAVRGSRMELPPADLLIVDECHHAQAATWRAIIDAYPNARVLGLTATPARGDGRGLGGIFDAMVECPDVRELTSLGFLVPISRVYAPVEADIAKGVHTRGGDYVEAELAERMNVPKLVGDIVGTWLAKAERRPTLCFATSVAHSIAIRDSFRMQGVLAEHLDGDTPATERDAILDGFAAGRVEVVTNCAVLTEGYDCPVASALILARPTKSLVMFRQMAGRVLRPAPGKVDSIILDHAGVVLNLGFPDEPVQWALSPDDRAVAPAQKARAEGQARTLTTCPECQAVRAQGEPCGACGWKPRKRGDDVETIDGELVPIGRKTRKGAKVVMTPVEREQFYRELLAINREHADWKCPGWAKAKYRDRFNDWPSYQFIEIPTAPSAETRSWVKSRQVAWFKSSEYRRRKAAA